MLCRVSFPAGSPYKATIVPKDAVVTQGSQRTVFVLQDGQANPVPVQMGAGAGLWVEVRGPIQPGQTVITRGNERLQPGQSVAGELLEYKLP
jgi:hypothetical protein